MKNKSARAFSILERFNNKDTAARTGQQILDSLKNQEKTSWRALLQPSLRLALLVGIGLSVFQQITGINAILYYAPEIFKSFGSNTDSSLLQTSLLGVVNMIFTIVAIYLVDKLGRKPLLYIGSAGMFVALAIVGIAAYYQITSAWLLPFLLLFMASFSISWGPVVWVLLAEIFPNRVRSLALSLAVFVQWIANFVVSQTFPLLIGDKWLQQTFHGAFPFLLFAVLCLLALLFVGKYVPETRNKTLEQMDELWHTARPSPASEPDVEAAKQ